MPAPRVSVRCIGMHRRWRSRSHLRAALPIISRRVLLGAGWHSTQKHRCAPVDMYGERAFVARRPLFVNSIDSRHSSDEKSARFKAAEKHVVIAADVPG